MRRVLGVLLAMALLAGPVVAAESVIDIPARSSVMHVLLTAPDAPPTAAVILIAGGAGRLDIEASGRIGSLGGNHVVRTRGEYAKAGFLVATPDVAEDLKSNEGGGVKNAYRWGAEQAADLGALIEYLRRQAPKVYIHGTSRGALSTANAAVRLKGEQRPDAIVISSGMIMQQDGSQPSVQRNVRPLGDITMPVLLVAHESDACGYTPARSVPAFKALLTAAPRVDIRMFSGGRPDKKGEECEAGGYHGLAGLDKDVVADVTAWLKGLN
jgi:dienelactone hydrolase